MEVVWEMAPVGGVAGGEGKLGSRSPLPMPEDPALSQSPHPEFLGVLRPQAGGSPGPSEELSSWKGRHSYEECPHPGASATTSTTLASCGD